MNSNYPDAYPGESKRQYLIRKEQEEQEELQQQNGNDSGIGLLISLAIISFFVLKIGAIFGIFIYTGYLLSQKLLGEESDKLKTWGFTLLFTYLIFCILFFLKGTIIGLRSRNRMLWILPWGICVLLCCVVPALIVKAFVGSMFNFAEQKQMWCIGLSWTAFVIFLLYTYGIYQFKTPTVPKILYWSYAIGLKISR